MKELSTFVLENGALSVIISARGRGAAGRRMAAASSACGRATLRWGRRLLCCSR